MAISDASVPRTPAEEKKDKDRGFRYYAKMRGLTSKVQLQALDYLVIGDSLQARAAISLHTVAQKGCVSYT